MKWMSYAELRILKDPTMVANWPKPRWSDQYAEEVAKATKQMTQGIENTIFNTTTCTATAAPSNWATTQWTLPANTTSVSVKNYDGGYEYTYTTSAGKTSREFRSASTLRAG